MLASSQSLQKDTFSNDLALADLRFDLIAAITVLNRGHWAVYWVFQESNPANDTGRHQAPATNDQLVVRGI